MTRQRIGLISDTHNLLRPEAVAALHGVDRIIHGGDIGDRGILDALAAIAPLTTVRGNNDRADWAASLADTEVVVVDDVWILVVHDLATLDIDPVAAGVQVVVSGHSHKPSITTRDGVLYVNPGSAGPRRFSLPITVAELIVEDASVDARIVDLVI